MKDLTIVHLSDLHFGGVADLAQIEELERLVPTLEPDVIAFSGDLTQRARHGEFQRARALVRQFQETAPTLVVPGNHDVTWWRSPFGVRGVREKYAKYRQYFGEDLTPRLEVPGMLLAGTLTAYGVALGSLTPNLRDLAVKGHLPKSETDRVTRLFQQAGEKVFRVIVLHHNVVRGQLSQRMGLARWPEAHRRLLETGADLVLCGHDHQEGADQLSDRLTISTAGTLSARMRGGRPPVFNLIKVDHQAVHVQFVRWESSAGTFRLSDVHSFAKRKYEPAGTKASAALERQAG
ncbi:MAG: metallophosphoesterase [Gemmatimonadales bacterium]|nr:metallophosphoesterase [Gemmatimonadales bacterium]